MAFGQAVLSFAGASLGSAPSAATLNANTNQVRSGRVGFVLALGTGSSFPAGGFSHN